MIHKFSKISNRFTGRSVGFTLPELVIAIFISGLIILGMMTFLTNLNKNIATSVAQGKVYVELTKFNEKIREYRRSFSDNIIVDVPGGYDALVLTNSGRTSGVLVGVVNTSQTNDSDAFLDPVANYSSYGRKALALTNVTSSQITAISASGATAVLTLPFPPENQFNTLNLSSLNIKGYNSNAIVEGSITVADGYFSQLIGTPTDSVPLGTPLSITLYF